MSRFAVASCLALVVYGGSAWAPSARAEDRSAAQILKELNAVELPAPPPPNQRGDQEVVRKFIAERQKAVTRRAELIGELYKVAPDNEELTTLLRERWQGLLQTDLGNAKRVKTELADVGSKAKSPALKAEAAFWKALIACQLDHDSDVAQKATDEFFQHAPKEDPRRRLLLLFTAGAAEDVETQRKLLNRLVHDYPDTPEAKGAQDELKTLEKVGKPFNLDFTDAIKGTEVSMKTLKGKVVVVDFWATWCGPCVAELPTMKKLYAEYKDQGVEFVGVSLDAPKEEGGLDKLKAFVTKNEVSWPQYYQGKGWESEFSKSWGISSIPAVFVVDAGGRLYSVNARGKLDRMIPALLKKSKAKSVSGAGGH